MGENRREVVWRGLWRKVILGMRDDVINLWETGEEGKRGRLKRKTILVLLNDVRRRKR